VRLTSSSNGDTETSIENATPSLFREEHTRLAQFMARRVFRQQMEKQLVDQVERCTIYGEISNTQLSRLHIVARRALIRLEGQQATSVQHIMEDVQQLLDTLPQNARHQFETARIQEHSLMKWLKIRINEPIHDWQDQMKPVVLASNKVNLDERLACEYTLRLIMAVAKQTVKQKEIA
jgi:CRISPR-associated protein Csx10